MSIRRSRNKPTGGCPSSSPLILSSILLLSFLLLMGISPSYGFLSPSLQQVQSKRSRSERTTASPHHIPVIVLQQQSASTVPPSSDNNNNNNNNNDEQQPQRQKEEESIGNSQTSTSKSLHPKIGDLVRYYDLDGGNQKGQELVGKITFITSLMTNDNNKKKKKDFLVELTELENVGDGYFAEYSSQKRMRKKTDRNLQSVSPIMASYVRSEQAYKVPLVGTSSSSSSDDDSRVRVRQETYDLDDYDGPNFLEIDENLVAQDGIKYGTLKFNLLKNAAITGLAGAAIANLLYGPEIGAIYLAGAFASVAYLFFLSIKTDTLASEDAKLGKNVSNLRFLMPVLVIVGVALYNQGKGDLNPLKDSNNMLDTVTTEQFGAAILGFLTYRLPLFVGQVVDAFKEDAAADGDLSSLLGGGVPTGSAGMVMQLAKKGSSSSSSSSTATTDGAIMAPELTPVLLVSGPQSTGRSELVQQLLQKDDRLVDPTGRYGLTKDAVLKATQRNLQDGGGGGGGYDK
eukprot:scaffold21824_cov89-Cylindrotheca_fusiformis.AAC.1